MAMLIDQDILDVERGIIVHQCNAKGVMGAGLALAIKNKYPMAYKNYRWSYENGALTLGGVQFVEVKAGIVVCNLIGQNGYGRVGMFTDYTAVRNGLELVKIYSDETKLQVYIPYKMSCGLAGGDWNILLQIIDETIPAAIICRKPGM
jgi:hypothetical protein